LMLMAVVGWIIKIYKNRHYIDWKRHIHWIWLGLANIIYFSLLIAWETTSTLQLGFGHGLQGRYFFILVSSHFAFLLAGWWWIFNEFLKPKTFAILLTGIFLIFNLFSLKHVLGAYYDFYPLKTFLLEVSQYKPEIAKWPNNLIIIIIWIISLISLLRSFKKMKNSFSK